MTDAWGEPDAARAMLYPPKPTSLSACSSISPTPPSFSLSVGRQRPEAGLFQAPGSAPAELAIGTDGLWQPDTAPACAHHRYAAVIVFAARLLFPTDAGWPSRCESAWVTAWGGCSSHYTTGGDPTAFRRSLASARVGGGAVDGRSQSKTPQAATNPGDGGETRRQLQLKSARRPLIVEPRSVSVM